MTAKPVGKLIPASGNSATATGLGDGLGETIAFAFGVGEGDGLAAGQVQFVWVVHKALRQKPFAQTSPLAQFAFDPQVPLQLFGAPPTGALGEGEGLGDDEGLGEAAGQVQLAWVVQEGFLQIPLEQTRPVEQLAF